MNKYGVLKIEKSESYFEVILADNPENALKDMLSVGFSTKVNIGEMQEAFAKLSLDVMYGIKDVTEVL